MNSLANFVDLLQSIRKIVQETVEANKPSGVYFGRVTSVSPIQISIDPHIVLTEEFLVLSRYITEFSVDITIESEMWHGLRPNDELLLIREQGGQRYIVMDWIKRVEEDDRPAWIKTGEVISESPLEIKVNSYFTLTADDLILCLGLQDKMGFLSFDNPNIKQKINIYDRAEAEPLPSTVTAGGEPHAPCPDDIPAPIVETTTDITFALKSFEDSDGPLPAYHEVTTYNKLKQGDKVLLMCERSSQKWYVVDFVYQNMDERS